MTKTICLCWLMIPCLALALALGSGCQSTSQRSQTIQVEPLQETVSPAKKTWNVPLGEESSLVEFKKLVSKVPLGKEIGSLTRGSNRLPFLWEREDWAYCHDAFPGLVYDQLKQANYSVTGNPDALFEDLFEKTSDFLIGASIVDIKLTGTMNVRTNATRIRTQLKVQWQVYSRRLSRIVYQTETEGTRWAKVGQSILTYESIYAEVLHDAIQGLLAEEAFYSLLTGKNKPSTDDKTRVAGETLVLPKLAESTQSLKDSIASRRASVVTVIRGEGHGSGFLIDRDGHLLTNHHVVGDDRLVTVRLATGRELIAEVIRVDADRDVALAKLEEGRMPALPIQQQSVNIGEEVYAMGTPLDRKLSTSLSRGIVSGFREQDGCRFVQSDVNILPGSSGGPLMDMHGNVLGISSRLITYGAAPSGINLFIPIQEALDALRIDLKSESLSSEEAAEAAASVDTSDLTVNPTP